MFSFEKGKAIAKIIGGIYDGQILHIDTEEPKKEKPKQKPKGKTVRGGAAPKPKSKPKPEPKSKGKYIECNECDDICCDDCNSEDCEYEACCKKCCLFTEEGSDIEENSDIEEDDYEELDEVVEEDRVTEMELPDEGVLQQIPDIEGRQVCYVAGPSGSGKSTYAAQYIAMYKKLFPENEIIVFSRKPSDPVLDKLKPSRFIIDESIVTNPIDITQDLDGPCLVLFDDVDTVQSDKIRKAVSKLKNDILEIGRSYEVYILVTSHLINGNDRKDSRTIFNELHTFTFFPKAGNRYAIDYALKNYFGLDKKTICKLMDLPSRWVSISRSFPQYALYENQKNRKK